MLHIPNFAAEIAQQEALDTEAKLLVQTILTRHTHWRLGPWGTSDTLYSAQDWQEAARLARSIAITIT
jgi:hypothetical protein